MQPGDVSAARLARLARGFNLTGWVDRDNPRTPDVKLLARLRALGFTHVRLPIEGEALMPAFADQAAIDARLNRIDDAVRLLLGLDYAVILDMHPGGTFSALHTEDPDRALQQLEAAWRGIATRFAGKDPDRIFFELLNEPSVTQSVWVPQASELATFVRGLAPNTTLIVGPAAYQSVSALSAMSPLDMPNVVYAVHFYQPMEFTHQGADWGDADNPLRVLKHVPYPLGKGDPRAKRLLRELTQAGETEAASRLEDAMGEDWDDARIRAALAPAATWALTYHKPIILDEFGVLGHYADSTDRSRWLSAVRTTAELYCFGWTHWEFAEGFGLLNDAGTDIDPALAKALLGPASKPR